MSLDPCLRLTGLPRLAGLALLVLVVAVSACSGTHAAPKASNPDPAVAEVDPYLIGPGDTLRIFVWQNPDLSITVPVRPDGRISMPLLQDMPAAQKTPPQLAEDIKKGLAEYIQQPVVTVTVTQFVGPYSEQVRVIGEAVKPKAIPYRARMSVLDVMIEVGGLTQFAAGNRAMIVRRQGSHETDVPVDLDSLLKDGDLSANVAVAPGDILVIPQSWF
jgi:polysaccharide export outer membrane protein